MYPSPISLVVSVDAKHHVYFVVVFNCVDFTWYGTELFRRAQRCGHSALSFSFTQPGQNAENKRRVQSKKPLTLIIFV